MPMKNEASASTSVRLAVDKMAEMRMNLSGLLCTHTASDDYVLSFRKRPKWDQREEKEAVVR